MDRPPDSGGFAAGRRWLPAILIGALLVNGVVRAAPPGAPRAAPAGGSRPVCIRGACFDAEIAATASERAQGLMGRDALAPDRGMLFIFPSAGRHGFWMKNTRIELDMIFIGADRKVVDIVHHARPCRSEPCETYIPKADSAFVLEVAGGRAAACGIDDGDPVEFAQTPGR